MIYPEEHKIDMKLFTQAMDTLIDSGIIHPKTEMKEKDALNHVMKLYERLYRSTYINKLPEKYKWSQDIAQLFKAHMKHRFEDARDEYDNRFNWKRAVKQAESDTFKYLTQGFIDLDEHNNIFIEYLINSDEDGEYIPRTGYINGRMLTITSLNVFAKEFIDNIYEWKQPPPEKYRPRIYWCIKTLLMLPCKHVSNDKE